MSRQTRRHEARQRAKGVPDEGRVVWQPQGADPSRGGPAIDYATWALVTIVVGAWVVGRVDPAAASLFSAIYIVSGLLLGLVSPMAGGVLVIALIPYRGASEAIPFGTAEFMRATPIWGGVARLLWDRWGPRRDVRANGGAQNPPTLLVVAALAAILLAPLQRLTATALGTFTAANQNVDMLGILGTQSLLYGAWIYASHLRREQVTTLLKALAASLTLAMVVAILAWQEFTPVSLFAFDGRVFGRLASLGYPTPTAMGVAIALPLAAGALWSWSRRAAVALFAFGALIIILTESRGPLLALGAAIALLLISVRGVKVRTALALGAVSIAALVALVVNRYGSDFNQLLKGRLPNIESDVDRITSWVAGVQTALQYPLTGGGWFSVRFWNEGQLGANNVNLSHNLILQGLADGGFPLGAAIATVVIGSVVLMIRNRRYIPLPWRMAVVALLVCGLWDMPQLRAFGALLGGISLGLVARAAPSREPGSPQD